MIETLLSETLGEDTTTQLYRDADGGYRLRVMALPPDGGKKLAAVASPRVFDDRPVSREAARALFRTSSAQRYAEESAAFDA